MTMDIVLAGNDFVIPGMELVIYSTMYYAKVPIRWHILTVGNDLEVVDENRNSVMCYRGIPDHVIDWFQYMVRFMGHKSELIKYQCNDLYYKYLDHSINRHTTFTPFTAFRLLIDKLLPEEITHCLYLDADVIVQDRLDFMYRYYIEKGNFNYAGYTIPEACYGYGEMIAGVLFLNIKYGKTSGFFDRARMNYCRKLYQFPDQGAITDASDPIPLHETFNYCNDIKKATYRPHIVHFTNDNYMKIYDAGHQQGQFYRYYPEYLYLKKGIDKIRECYERDL